MPKEISWVLAKIYKRESKYSSLLAQWDKEGQKQSSYEKNIIFEKLFRIIKIRLKIKFKSAETT